MAKRTYSNTGKPTEEKCPKCGRVILYNGNYFCEHWTSYYDGSPVNREAGECDWVLPHPQTELVDKQIYFRLCGYWEEGEKIINGEARWIIHREEPK